MSHPDLPWTSLRSDGALNARGYVKASVPPSRPGPVPEADRVMFVDPRRTKTTPTGNGARGRPRAPEQMRLPKPAPAIHLPDERPLTKAQRVWIEPELLAQWEAEARRDGLEAEAGAPRD